jgi:hypothetical protein
LQAARSGLERGTPFGKLDRQKNRLPPHDRIMAEVNMGHFFRGWRQKVVK